MSRVPDCVVRIGSLAECDSALLTQSAATVGYQASPPWRDG
jgi:hypothetical protein